MPAAKEDYRDLIAPDERRRLIDAQLTGLASERYAMHVAELAGNEINEDRKKVLDDGISELLKEKAAVKDGDE